VSQRHPDQLHTYRPKEVTVKQLKTRSTVARAAWDRPGAGTHRDRRKENRDDRGAAKRRAIKEQM
jgi:hypothetical protein